MSVPIPEQQGTVISSKSLPTTVPDTEMHEIVGIVEVSKKKRVLVLYVGGTLGMIPNEKNALEPKKGYLTTEMRNMHELQSPSMPEFDIVEYEELVDSSDVCASDWIKIGQDIEANYMSYDGFLIAHGTDTMHYTASALSFLLHNLGKPVIVTGAMVPFAEPYNDARRNLIVSMIFAGTSEICEVCIFFNDVLLRGTRAVKLRHTMTAFESPNYPPLCVMEAHQFELRRSLLMPPPTGQLHLNSTMDGRVMTFIIAPDSDISGILSLCTLNSGSSAASCTPSRAAAGVEAMFDNKATESSQTCSLATVKHKKREAPPTVAPGQGTTSGITNFAVRTSILYRIKPEMEPLAQIRQRLQQSSIANANNNNNGGSVMVPNSRRSVPLGKSSSAEAMSLVSTSHSRSLREDRKMRKIDCLILETNGIGGRETAHALMLRTIVDAAVKAGIVICLTNQDAGGGLHEHARERAQRFFPEVVFLNDMTTETAVVKAMYLFGIGLSPADVMMWFPRNIRGEVTPLKQTASHL